MNEASLQVKPYLTGTGRIEVRGDVTRLIVPQAAHTQYADAQLDDRLVVHNQSLIHRPPLRLTIRARFSGESMLGTAGFGFWNHPLLAPSNPVPLPRAIWFFYASPPSHMDLAMDVPGYGWKAAMIDATRLGAMAMAPLALPVVLLNRSERWYRRVGRSCKRIYRSRRGRCRLICCRSGTHTRSNGAAITRASWWTIRSC